MTAVAPWWGAAGGLLGLVAGSFIATLVARWPQERSLGGRSACDGCGRSLAIRDLAPLLSWAIAGGRCRTCEARIDLRHPLIEAIAAGIGAVAFIAMPGIAGLAGALFGWQLLALAALDFEHYWLPDRLTATLALSGLLAAILGVEPAFIDRIIGGAAGFLSLWLIARSYRRLRSREGLGGGDPKLLGAIGCWLGWQPLPLVVLGASIGGLGFVLARQLRGHAIDAQTRVALGTWLAAAAFPLWIWAQL